MHAGPKPEALSGLYHGAAFLGGENLSGGEAANGIPRNLFTVAVADGIEVIVPTTKPESITTVGRENDRGMKKQKSNRVFARIIRRPMVTAGVEIVKLDSHLGKH